MKKISLEFTNWLKEEKGIIQAFAEDLELAQLNFVVY